MSLKEVNLFISFLRMGQSIHTPTSTTQYTYKMGFIAENVTSHKSVEHTSSQTFITL